MVTQESKDAAFGAKLFYNGIMFGLVGMFIIFDNNLQKAMLNLDLLYTFGFFGLFGLSYYLFNITGHNPGFLEQNLSTQELSSIKSDSLEGDEVLLKPQAAQNGALNIDLEAAPSTAEGSTQNIDETIKAAYNKTSYYDANGQRYCDICRVFQPYRTKHCKQCERCIHKFDHHCFWIGGCVGELNHRKFWLFLFFQTILELWAYSLADSGLDAGYAKGVQLVRSGTKGITSPYATTEYGAFTVGVGVSILTFLFTGILLGFHTFLILTNQSTWEFSKKDSLNYLKEYPRSFYPFSAGFIGNIRLTFFHGNVPRQWELPQIEFDHKKKGFNWCENEYYSCC